MNISISKDFSEDTGLRTSDLSDFSGEDFYHILLNEKFYQSSIIGEKLIVDLDFTSGYAPSFLDEAFGNLVFDFGIKYVREFLEIKSIEEPYLKEMIIDTTFKQWDIRRKKNQEPKVTKKHAPWYRLVNDNFVKKIWILPKY